MPLTMSPFTTGFGLEELTQSIIARPYTPTLLGDLGIFEAESLATNSVTLETDGRTVGLVDIRPRNAPAQVVEAVNKRKLQSFVIPHLPQRATVMADEVLNVREFGSTNQLRTVESVINKRLQRMREQIDYTMESHRLQAVLGNYYSATGALTSLYTEMGVKKKSIAIDLTSNSLELEVEMMRIHEAMEAALDGIPYTGIQIIYGATKWKQLIACPSIKATMQNWAAAVNLGRDPRTPMTYGDAQHVRYRGSNLVKVPDDKAYAIPLGVAGQFKHFFAPANYMETVNTMAQPYYAKSEILEFGKGMQIEAQTNVLTLNTLPAAVIEIA
jgi:hypothetical protein